MNAIIPPMNVTIRPSIINGPAALAFALLTTLTWIQPASAQTTVAGGTLTGLDGDFVYANPGFGPGGTRFQDGGDANGSCAATLDMGTYRWVNQITVLNRNVASGGQMNNLYAAVSVNQTAPTTLSGYNMSMNAGSSGGPTPVDAGASVSRTLNLSRPVYRRYLGLTGITSLGWGNGIADIGDLNVSGSAPTALSMGNGLTVMAQAGTDILANIGELGAPTSFQALGQGGDNKIYLLLDAGVATAMTGVEFINRLDNAPSSYSVGAMTIWAAADESAPGFDPQLQSSFTVSLATGTPSPDVIDAGASRTLSFTGGKTTRQYLLLEVTGNLFGDFGEANQNFQIGDINVIPEPTINVSASLTNFSATAGSASVSQSFSAGGTALTDDILVTAPADYEVSTNNTAFAASVTLFASGGTVSATAVYVRIAASAPIGSPAGLISLTSTGASTQNIAVAGTVSAAAETFANWAQGAPLNSANLLRYAIGGASGPSATNGIAMSNTVTSSNISITAIVRTNDPSLTVLGQALTDLTVGPWSTNNVTMQPGDQNGVGEGLQRQIWSTPRNGAAKKFLRLQSTLDEQ